MSIIFENLSISRVTIHEIFQIEETGKIVTPIYGESLVELDQESIDALRERILAAMGSASKSVQMDIIHSDAGSLFKNAVDLVDGDDNNFLTTSKLVADKLVSAQSRRNLPGGILITFDGLVGDPEKRIVGFIKAETHTGFTKDLAPQGGLRLKFLKNLILTPQTKLYKIGVFAEEIRGVEKIEKGWSAYVYDDLINGGDKSSAAIYFYEKFLGCGFPDSSARLTKKFFDLTRSFINGLPIDDGQKYNLHNGLISYLKHVQSPTIQVAEFSKAYIPMPSDRDLYGGYMKESDFPTTAFTKDLSDLMTELRERKIHFHNNIKLTAPADKFQEYVVIESVDGGFEEDGTVRKWTKITIKDKIRNQQ